MTRCVSYGSSDDASVTVDEAGDKLTSLSLPDAEDINDGRVSELYSIISAMHASESGGASYDPMGKFDYQTTEETQDNDLGIEMKLVDERCRARMLDWMQSMVDCLNMDRRIVALAAYYQDRFLGTEMGCKILYNRALFRVVSVTSLYIAIKTRGPPSWDITAYDFAQLCQGSVSGDEINDMEIQILFALGWNVNPPLPMEYSEAYLKLIFESRDVTSQRTVSDDLVDASRLKDTIIESVNYQLETALQDNRLFHVRSSAIAAAAVLNSLEGMDAEEASFCQERLAMILRTMAMEDISRLRRIEVQLR